MKKVYTFFTLAFLTFSLGLNANDCLTATDAIISCGGTITLTGSTTGGTPPAISTCGTSAGTGGAVWYKIYGDGNSWTASTDNPGTNYDTKIWVFSGDCNNLTCVTGNDDGGTGLTSLVTFTANAGETYYVIVGGFSSSEGNYELTISNSGTACAQECTSAINVSNASSCPIYLSGTTVGGTPQTQGTCTTTAGTGGANWYAFTGNGNTWSATTDNPLTNYDTKIWVFTGTCGSLTCVTGNDDGGTGLTSLVNFSTVNGQTYYIVVGGFSSSEGEYELSVMTNSNPFPTVTANASATTVCQGDLVTFTGSGAVSYNWNNGVTDGVPISVTNTATYGVIGTDANGCTATDQITVTVNPLPTVTANASATSVCQGDQVTLTGSGATTYSWDNGVTDGVAFTPTTTTTYTVTGTDANGCSNTDQVTVTVNPLPTVTANASATSVCQGDQVTLTGSGATTYSWDNGVTDGVAFTPTATTTYTVTGTDANGCSNTDQVTVTVNPLPTVTANASATSVCQGNQVTLIGSGASTYSWDNGVTDGVAFTPTATTTYTVTGTDANGCSNTDQVTVTVNPLPTVTANASATSVCQGDQVTLTGSGASTYSWDNGVTDGVAFTPTATTTYTVTGTDANGCSNTDQVTVTVNPLPTVTANASATSVCQGDQVTLTGSGASTYSWDNGVTDGVAFTPTTTTTYTVTGTDANGCSANDSITVTVLMPSSSSQTVTSCSSYTSPSGNYTWTTSGIYTDTIPNAAGCDSVITVNLTINNATSSTLSPVVCDSYTSPSGNYVWTQSGTYMDTIPNSNGCDSVITINLTVNTVDVSVTNNDPVLTANAVNATYQWVDCPAMVPINGETSATFTATVNGSYAVIVTQNGCTDTSACETITSVGIEELTGTNVVRVYPNPTTGKFTIELAKNFTNVKVNITNALGQVVYQDELQSAVNIPVEMENSSKGVYFVQVYAENKIIASFKIRKQ